jgi:hypothetical protein
MINFSYYDVKQTSSVKEIMKIIFKTDKQVTIATKIVETIKSKNGIYDREMKELARSSDCSEKWFYSKVLRTLQRLGMVRKDLNRYILSREFANALRRLERSWREIV